MTPAKDLPPLTKENVQTARSAFGVATLAGKTMFCLAVCWRGESPGVVGSIRGQGEREPGVLGVGVGGI